MIQTIHHLKIQAIYHNMKKIILEQANVGSKDYNYLKQALDNNCFDSFRDLQLNDNPIKKYQGRSVIVGKKLSTGETILIYADNTMENYQTGKTKRWYCQALVDLKNQEESETKAQRTFKNVLYDTKKQVDYLTRYIAKYPDYEVETPSDYDLQYSYETPIDLNSINSTVFPIPGKFFLYMSNEKSNKRKEQTNAEANDAKQAEEKKKNEKLNQAQQNIKDTLIAAGYAFEGVNPGTPEYNNEIDLRKIMGGKYAKFFTEYTPIWFTGNTETQGEINRSECKNRILKLYRAASKNDVNYKSDSEILNDVNYVVKCISKDKNFVSGKLGVGDELQYLERNSGPYGIRVYIKEGVKPQQALNEMVRKKLLMVKENKTKQLSESKIINSRFNILVEGKEMKTKNDYFNMFESLMVESRYLQSQNFNQDLINESVMDFLSGIFPGSKRGIWSMAKEYLISYLLKALGVDPNGWIASIIEVSLSNIAIEDIPKLFSDCQFLTDTLVKSLPEAIAKKLLAAQGFDGVFSNIMRNVIVELIYDTKFAEMLKEKLGKEICSKMPELKDKMGSVVDGLKDKITK